MFLLITHIRPENKMIQQLTISYPNIRLLDNNTTRPKQDT